MKETKKNLSLVGRLKEKCQNKVHSIKSHCILAVAYYLVPKKLKHKIKTMQWMNLLIATKSTKSVTPF